MRRPLIMSLLLAAGLLLIACQPQEIVIPTAAQLPTITPTPTEARTEEAFVTDTPLPMPEVSTDTPLPQPDVSTDITPLATEPPPDTAVPSDPGGAPPAEAGSGTGLILVTPTPETLNDPVGPVLSGGPGGPGVGALQCSQAEINAVLTNNSDVAALRADLQTLVEQLPVAASTVGEWVVDPAYDSFANAADADLPVATIRYTRAADTGQQEMLVRLWLTDDSLRSLFNRCLTDDILFVQQGGELGVPAAVTLESLPLGDAAAVGRLVLPANSPDMAGAGITEFQADVYFVLRGYLVAQYVNPGQAAQFTGGVVVSETDAQAMLAALVDVLAAIL
ncbi:MAG: hypothetical protein JW910_07025 [Anaerolineae bacterium]|nr:hypothetical protein [Anaerolineae bacterium]